MKNKKGFTLIELLAVIVILAIIALIAIPTVKKTVDEAKKQGFMNTAYGLIKAGDLYYSRKDIIGEKFDEKTFTFPDGAEELEMSGKLPKNGQMTINKKGGISLTILNNKYCITKGYEDKDITVTEDLEECNILGEESDNENNSSDNENTSSGSSVKTLSQLI